MVRLVWLSGILGAACAFISLQMNVGLMQAVQVFGMAWSASFVLLLLVEILAATLQTDADT